MGAAETIGAPWSKSSASSDAISVAKISSIVNMLQFVKPFI